MKFYYSAGAYSLAAHILLEELGERYETEELIFQRGDYMRSDILKLNPTGGGVPILVLDNGVVLHQTLAILTHLADQKESLRLIGRSGTVERALAMEWLTLTAVELLRAFDLVQNAKHFGSRPEVIDDVGKRGREMLLQTMDLVEMRLPGQGFVLGAYSVVDAHLYVFFSWLEHLSFDWQRWPKSESLHERIAARPATLRALRNEGLIGPA